MLKKNYGSKQSKKRVKLQHLSLNSKIKDIEKIIYGQNEPITRINNAEGVAIILSVLYCYNIMRRLFLIYYSVSFQYLSSKYSIISFLNIWLFLFCLFYIFFFVVLLFVFIFVCLFLFFSFHFLCLNNRLDASDAFFA